MNLLVLAIVAIFLSSIFVDNYSYSIQVSKDPDKLWDESKIILVGKIIDVQELVYDKTINNYQNNTKTISINQDLYTVEVEKYVKNTFDKKIIKVKQPLLSIPGGFSGISSFEVGDRVLFYFYESYGDETYAPESCLIDFDCKGGQVSKVALVYNNNDNANSNITAIYIVIAIICAVIAGTTIIIMSKQLRK